MFFKKKSPQPAELRNDYTTDGKDLNNLCFTCKNGFSRFSREKKFWADYKSYDLVNVIRTTCYADTDDGLHFYEPTIICSKYENKEK